MSNHSAHRLHPFQLCTGARYSPFQARVPICNSYVLALAHAIGQAWLDTIHLLMGYTRHDT